MRDCFVCTSVASAAVKLVPAAAAVEQSISYSLKSADELSPTRIFKAIVKGFARYGRVETS
jgi:hypothetical protein